MDDMALCQRVRAAMERQIAWMETALRDLEGLESGGNEAALEHLAATQKTREKQLADLLREQRTLLAEWRAAQGIPAEERERMRRLAAGAEKLAGRLRRRYDEAVAWADAEKKHCAEAMQSVRRGRDMITRYRPGIDEPPGFIDRNA